MATSRTKRSKKTTDDPEVTATAPLTSEEEPSPPTDPAPETPKAPEPPPPPPPAPKAAPKAKVEGWVVKVDGKVVGDVHPNRMAAIRAGMALKTNGHVSVDQA